MSTRTIKLVELIATAIDARKRCLENGNDYAAKWDSTLDQCDDLLPSGSGLDSGSKIDRDRSTGDRVLINTSYHHMTEHGFYDGWTEHVISARPSFVLGIDLKISGRDRNDIKEMIAQSFESVLSGMVEWGADSVKEVRP